MIISYRLFMVAEVGMLAGTVFLLASSREVDPKWRKGVYVSAVITGTLGITAKDDVYQGYTPVRYVDWVLTVP